MSQNRGRPWAMFVVALASVVFFGARDAFADQCASVSAAQATAARQILLAATALVPLCEPCGERVAAAAPQPVRNVTIQPLSGSGDLWAVTANNRALDLAYTFTSTDGLTFTNLARAVGCPASDVSDSFPLPRSNGGVVVFGAPYVQPSAPAAVSVSATVMPAVRQDTPPETLSLGTAPTTRWRRPVGLVHMGITALLVAPGKSSGAPWDGLGTLPLDVQQGLRTGVTTQLVRQIFSTFVETGTGAAVATRLLPWALNALTQATAAPDVQAALLLDGVRIGRAQTRTHTFNPSWPGMTTTAYAVGPNQQIVIDAADTDLMFNDPIGMCSIQGMPLVDRNGYARAEDFTCNGQLWGVRLRIQASSYEPVADADIPLPAVSAGAPNAPSAFAGPTAAPQEATPAAEPQPAQVRRGGAGESCTRTDDCDAPLRCIRHECTAPPQ